MRALHSLAALVLLLVATALALGGDERGRPARALLHDVNQATVKQVPPKHSAEDDSLRLLLSVPMPSPGWKLTTRSVGRPDASGLVRVDLEGTRLPGLWPAAIQQFEHEIDLGALPEGAYVLDIWVHDDIQGASRVGATMFTAVGAP